MAGRNLNIFGEPETSNNSEKNGEQTLDQLKKSLGVQSEPRIIGGHEAPSGKYKGIISLQTRQGGLHFCGGSLVDPRTIITAAHCFVDVLGRIAIPNLVSILKIKWLFE